VDSGCVARQQPPGSDPSSYDFSTRQSAARATVFSELASVLVYVVALVGIMDTVFEERISAVLATSGMLAIVPGLTPQHTLADVFCGVAINIEHPFASGDWITVSDQVEGQVIEINWRATRIKTSSNDMIVIPNSVVAKALVTNHGRLSEPHLCTIAVKVDRFAIGSALSKRPELSCWSCDQNELCRSTTKQPFDPMRAPFWAVCRATRPIEQGRA